MAEPNILLHRVGEAIWGETWGHEMARFLKISDRSLRRFSAGTAPIPIGVWKELFIRLDVKRDEVNFVIEQTKVFVDGRQAAA